MLWYFSLSVFCFAGSHRIFQITGFFRLSSSTVRGSASTGRSLSGLKGLYTCPLSQSLKL